MDANQKAKVEGLLDKALTALDGAQAMHYTQAACNAATALRLLEEIKRMAPTPKDGAP